MDASNKALNENEITDGKKRANKWVDEYIAKERSKRAIIKGMVSNTEYVEWLYQFTQDKDSFSDNEWLYFPEKISQSDRKNVEKLSLFYEIIEEYAEENYIYPTPCDFGNFYRVKSNDFGFEIGVLIGQGTVFFFNKSSLENDKVFIDFHDVITGKKQNNVDTINDALNSLSDTIKSAYDSGVPIEAIEGIFDKTIKSIKEDKPKTLVISKK